MNTVLGPLLHVVNLLLDLYIWAIIITTALSWLIAFGVVNISNRLVYAINDTLHRVTEPILRPIRRLVSPIGGVDMSPLIALLVMLLLQGVTRNLMLQTAARLF